MTLHRLLQILRRHLLVIVLCPVLGAAAAFGYTQTQEPAYTARAELFVATTTKDKTGSELVNSGLYAANMVSSYAGVATSPAVLDEVAEDLGLDMSAGELATHVTATVPANTVLIQIDVEYGDPDTAAEIANAIADELPSVVGDLTQPSTNVDSPVELRLVEEATPNPNQVSPQPVLNLLVGIVLGGVLGLAIAVVLEAFRRRVTSVIEVESATGLPVVGILPDDDDHPAAADAKRVVWSAVVAASGHAPRALLFASASESSRSGKIGGRLAPVIADTDRTVAWVDADLLGGRASAALEVQRTPGLAELLIGEAELDEAVHPWRDSSLCVVPAGAPTTDLGRAFSGPRLGVIADSLRAGFETTVIDATGINQVPEVSLLGQYVDAVVLVATPSSTRHQLSAVVRSLRSGGLNLVGVVVDEVPERDRADFERRFLSTDDMVYDA